MKNYDDIISSFESIPELSVSEELLGAYIEGNLEGDELIDVRYLVQEDSLLNTLAYEITTDDIIEYSTSDIIDIDDTIHLPIIIDFVPFHNTSELPNELEEICAQTDLCDCSAEEYSFEDNYTISEPQFDNADENFGINDDSLDESSLNDIEI